MGGGNLQTRGFGKSKDLGVRSQKITGDQEVGSLGPAGLVQVGVGFEKALNAKMRAWKFTAGPKSWSQS